MAEADASAEVHQTVHDELQNDVVPAIKSWQKAKYIKSMMHIKSTKDFDDEFRRVRISYDSFCPFQEFQSNRHKKSGQNCMLKLTNINVNIMPQRKVLKWLKLKKITQNSMVHLHRNK